MTTIPITLLRHWQQRFPDDPTDPGVAPWIVLNADIQEWLDDNRMAPKILHSKHAHPSKRFQVSVVELQFDDPDDALMFKLTWL